MQNRAVLRNEECVVDERGRKKGRKRQEKEGEPESEVGVSH